MVQGKWEGYCLMGKLRVLKGNLIVWSREVFGDILIRKKEILAIIDEIDNLEL